jgi:uncharacterized membrane protein
VAGPTAELVAAAYPSLAAAEEALAAAEQLSLRDAAIVARGVDGRIQLRQTRQTGVGEGAIAGGTVGLLAGLLVGFPVAVALAGLAAGFGFAARDTGIPDERLRALGDSLEHDQTVLCVLVDSGDVPAVAAALAPFGGELLP